jgi:hypothetical protein
MSIKEIDEMSDKAKADNKVIREAATGLALRAKLVRGLNSINEDRAHNFSIDKILFDIESEAKRLDAHRIELYGRYVALVDQHIQK